MPETGLLPHLLAAPPVSGMFLFFILLSRFRRAYAVLQGRDFTV